MSELDDLEEISEQMCRRINADARHKEDQRTDEQITVFVGSVMETFSSLSSAERRELRNLHRRRFVDDSITAHRPYIWANYGPETLFDNLDFQGG
jgi:hypothetical protein